jgi:CO dehydrogenase maturation factor
VKIAVSGKGGVGKTTLAAMLTGAMALKGRGVIAIDADPDANLAAALGLPPDSQPAALSEMDDLIAERTGSGGPGGYFKLNPKVDDLPDAFAAGIANIRLLVLGGVKHGGSGCICPATALVKALLMHLILGRDEALVMDMEAGIEHLGRATGQSMDAMLVVVDDGPWSVQTAHRVRRLAGEIGMARVFAVANRVSGPADVERIRGELGDIPLVGEVPHDDRLRQALVRVTGADELAATEGLAAHLPAVEGILDRLQAAIEGSRAASGGAAADAPASAGAPALPGESPQDEP